MLKYMGYIYPLMKAKSIGLPQADEIVVATPGSIILTFKRLAHPDSENCVNVKLKSPAHNKGKFKSNLSICIC